MRYLHFFTTTRVSSSHSPHTELTRRESVKHTAVTSAVSSYPAAVTVSFRYSVLCNQLYHGVISDSAPNLIDTDVRRPKCECTATLSVKSVKDKKSPLTHNYDTALCVELTE